MRAFNRSKSFTLLEQEVDSLFIFFLFRSRTRLFRVFLIFFSLSTVHSMVIICYAEVRFGSIIGNGVLLCCDDDYYNYRYNFVALFENRHTKNIHESLST